MRRALVALSALGALAAVVVGGTKTWSDLRPVAPHADQGQSALAPAAHEGLPVATFERWKRQLRPGDRWWLEIPAGEPEGLTNRGAVYRAFAIYYFLPALPATSKQDATVVFHLAAAR